ncbi:acyl carrier protein [Micromonospora sp. NPDC005203]|uniref:acyl carrier protein n=1 Tax=Micromonospora sp. NPDC005203 TaxID=3364226 RepID=UPI0036CD0E81
MVLNQGAELGVEPAAVTLTARLDGLGLDSLDIMEMSQQVRRGLGVTLSAKDFAETACFRGAHDQVTAAVGPVAEHA